MFQPLYVFCYLDTNRFNLIFLYLFQIWRVSASPASPSRGPATSHSPSSRSRCPPPPSSTPPHPPSHPPHPHQYRQHPYQQTLNKSRGFRSAKCLRCANAAIQSSGKLKEFRFTAQVHAARFSCLVAAISLVLQSIPQSRFCCTKTNNSINASVADPDPDVFCGFQIQPCTVFTGHRID